MLCIAGCSRGRLLHTGMRLLICGGYAGSSGGSVSSGTFSSLFSVSDVAFPGGCGLYGATGRLNAGFSSKAAGGMYFLKSHEYIKIDAAGKMATLGLSQHAVEELGEVAFVEMPAVGTPAKRGELIATVASIKAVGDVYSPVDGTVVSTNEEIESDSSKVTQDPENSGWILKIELSSEVLPDGLLTREEYNKHCAEEKLDGD